MSRKLTIKSGTEGSLWTPGINQYNRGVLAETIAADIGSTYETVYSQLAGLATVKCEIVLWVAVMSGKMTEEDANSLVSEPLFQPQKQES